MKRVMVKDSYYGEKLFDKKSFTFAENKLNILIGPNGSGKTSLLRELSDKFSSNSASWFVTSDSGMSARNKALGSGKFDLGSTLMGSSEGQCIVVSINTLFARIKKVRPYLDAKDKVIWIFVDGIDSGLDIDNINEFKGLIMDLIKKLNKFDITVYPVLSANTYEMVYGEDCVYVKDNTHITFKDYDEYRSFIIEKSKGSDRSVDKK